jgi:hypothetical protein
VTSNQTLLEYTRAGTLVQSISVPVVEPGTGSLRDVVVDSNGNAQMFNGTFNAALTTYNPNTNTFTTTPITGGLHTVNNVTFGGITAFGPYVFLATNATGPNPLNGLVRVDVNNLSSQTRFGSGSFGIGDFIQVTAGRDGLIYGLVGSGSPAGTEIDVFDPNTLALIRKITLASPSGDLRDIAVDANGNIFGVSFFKDANGKSLYEFGPNGNLINSLALPTPFNNFVGSTVELSAAGDVLVASPSGQIFLTNESFTGLTSFNVAGANGNELFATFVEPPPGAALATIPEPATGLALGVGLVLLSLVRRRGRRAVRNLSAGNPS